VAGLTPWGEQPDAGPAPGDPNHVMTSTSDRTVVRPPGPRSAKPARLTRALRRDPRPLVRALVGALAVVLSAPAGAAAMIDAASPSAAPAAAGAPAPVELRGVLHAVAADDFRSRSETFYSLETADGMIALSVPAGTIVPRDGTSVRVRGVRRPGAAGGAPGAGVAGGPGRPAGSIAVTSIRTQAEQSPAASSFPAVAETASIRSVLVIIARFTDDASDPVTPAQAAATFTGTGATVQAFYAATSRGRVTTATTVVASSSLGIASTCDANAVWAAGDTVAKAHGFDPGSYDHVVVWTDQPPCAWWVGVGTIGWNKVWISESFPGGSSGGATMTVVASHEMGHNLGLLHASSYPCFDGSGDQVTTGGTCEPVEYGDVFSAMGQGYSYESLFDSGELGILGWLGTGEAASVGAVGTYTLVPVYSATPGVRLLRVPRTALFTDSGAGSWWLEIRGALAGSFDRFGSVPAGVTVRFSAAPASGNSYLVDATPTGSGGAGAIFNDAPFAAGQTFADPAGGLTIHVDAAGPSGATVTIGDSQPPTAPGSLGATTDVGGLRLDWTAATDNLGVAGYVVRRDGQAIATPPASARSYVDGAASPDSSHSYDVSAVDTAGLEGPAASVTAAPPAAPGAPTGVTAIAGDQAATISWSAPGDNGGSPITAYVVTADPDGQTCGTTGARTCTVTGLANGTAYAFTVVAINGVGPGPASAASDPVTPRAPPLASMTRLPTWTVSTTIPLGWAGVPGSAALATFDVRYRRAAWNGGFGPYVTWRSATATTSARFGASTGSTYCFSARARDVTAVVSAWTPETCTATPLDDRSLTRSVKWTARTGSAYYRSTNVRSSTFGARLVRTGVRARSIAIVATTCPTCGKIRVSWGSKVLRTINLASRTTVNRRLFSVTTFPSARAGTLTIRVWSSGRKVIIDGVAVRRL